MLTGPNIAATAALAESVSTPVIASGGITDIDDISALCEVAASGIMGAITGRAIYEERSISPDPEVGWMTVRIN